MWTPCPSASSPTWQSNSTLQCALMQEPRLLRDHLCRMHFGLQQQTQQRPRSCHLPPPGIHSGEKGAPIYVHCPLLPPCVWRAWEDKLQKLTLRMRPQEGRIVTWQPMYYSCLLLLKYRQMC